ncbi:hypothetical protein [Paenibacillus sp. 32O-W]|uniref:hypothetical protein n=1 Tax=Paenibacillus sp. 32O-W TaxID=1695218 RepID=UPI00119EDA1A|nr:hypothetical protein [Paenibacillus sp. 32O-W]
MKKKIIALVMVLTLSLSSIVLAEENKLNGVAYNPYTLEEISQLDNISLSFDEETVELSFSYLDQEFSLEAKSFESDNRMTKYTSKEGSVVTNILIYEGMVTGQIIDTALTFEEKYYNSEDNFNFSITNGNLVTTQSFVDLKNTPEIKSRIDRMLSFLDEDNVEPLSSSKRIHVQASGLDIPFLIDGGFAEGWVTSTLMYDNLYAVNELAYNVARNWPSDGVSLWRDNFTEAWRTPAWVSPGYTEVDGGWDIDVTTGRFLAEATVSAAVKGVPIFWTVYDESLLW